MKWSRSIAFVTATLISLVLGRQSFAEDLGEFTIKNDWITLSDGVKVAVTFFLPESASEGATVPALLEMLPYRKDDLFKGLDYSLYPYFARRGFAMAKVDIRGTGSSFGSLPDREYSDVELRDAEEIIEELAAMSWCNGRVGMWGISWGGFNALQVAMRQPRHLYAVLAAHASDDLFHDDVHYIDGVLHVDEYALSINHINGFLRSPDYAIDDAYFKERFDATPWLFTYLKHNQDGEFWRGRSLRWQYERIRVPVFLIGGLYDGYKDTIPRVLEHLNVPVKAVIGPWNHAWPDNAGIGPNWEWRAEAVKWWDRWLRDERPEDMKSKASGAPEKSFRFFLRDAYAPDSSLKMVPGQWCESTWPPDDRQIKRQTYFPDLRGNLKKSLAATKPGMHSLKTRPSAGIELGHWWGELTPDMRAVDAFSLVYDSDVIEKTTPIVGTAEARLLAAADAKDANWIVRLEDVHPDGSVSLVTGGALNASQRSDRLAPSSLTPGQAEELSVPLHFTTWTFEPGHRIRLAISNSAFPMLWPSSGLTHSELHVGTRMTALTLPVWRGNGPDEPGPQMEPPTPRDAPSKEVVSYDFSSVAPPRHQVIHDSVEGSVRVENEQSGSFTVGDESQPQGAVTIDTFRKTAYKTHDANPADSSFSGTAEYRLNRKGEADLALSEIRYRTEIN
ncbi:MAG: CocE/NonD family hydrolase, partial [Candidatus Hydrogenedentota bacterium]